MLFWSTWDFQEAGKPTKFKSSPHGFKKEGFPSLISVSPRGSRSSGPRDIGAKDAQHTEATCEFPEIGGSSIRSSRALRIRKGV